MTTKQNSAPDNDDCVHSGEDVVQAWRRAERQANTPPQLRKVNKRSTRKSTNDRIIHAATLNTTVSYCHTGRPGTSIYLWPYPTQLLSTSSGPSLKYQSTIHTSSSHPFIKHKFRPREEFSTHKRWSYPTSTVHAPMPEVEMVAATHPG